MILYNPGMTFWISSASTIERRRLLMQGLAAFFVLLALSLSGCGSKRSMEGARSDDELGTVQEEESATQVEGQEEEAVSFDEAAEARRRKVAAIKGGNTRSGPGKLDSVTTKEGDTLWKLAERKDIYGSGWLYPLIYKANKEKIKDPRKLEAGLVLKIPRDVPDPEVEIAKEEAMTGQILDAPVAAAPKAPAAPAKPAARKGGWGWLLWLLLLAAAGGGAYAWWRKRQAAAEPPAA